MKLNYKYLTLFLVLFTFSCGGNKGLFSSKKKTQKERTDERRRVALEENERAPARVPEEAGEVREELPRKTYKDIVEEYIDIYAPLAMEEMATYKIPASITLAQGILESGAGVGDLTRRANNHFGIKCHGWKGGKVYHDDDEAQECFRKYNDPKYSFRDHSLFLTERKRYAALFDLDIEDYRGWAKGLRAAGYATDRKYPDKLISLIERYQLYLYDARVLGKEPMIAHQSNTTSKKYVVRKGDTLYSIAKRYNLSVEQLKEYNNLRSTNIGVGQELYVTPD